MASPPLSKTHWHWSGHAAVEQSTAATVLAQLLLRHVATGSAFALGLDAAHFNVHAVSLHAQASAHSWDAAQAELAKQELMASPHLSKPHWHWSGHAAVEQSTAATVLAQLLLRHVATGSAPM